ncbi:MAG TPA: hypothetical protein VF765_34145 [Polyangiaceae bacterium]
MRRRFRVVVVALSACASALSFSPTARAQSAADKAAAQTLFDDAQKAAASGDWASACPKYAESNRLDPGIGVKLYLADCYEHVGKTASAWAMFAEAEEYAHKEGDARVAAAKRREDNLAPRLVRLVIAVPDTRAQGMDVRRDGEEVGAAQWGIPVPIDPGAHTIAVTAPGKRAWSTTVQATEGQGTVRVDVPTLEDEAAQPSAAPPAGVSAEATPAPAASTAGPWSTQRIVALVVGGAGIVGIGIGTGFGLVAKSKLDQSNDGHCHGANLCDATGVQLRSDSLSAALVSTIAFSVGLAAVAGGVVLWLTAPKAEQASPSVGLSPLVTDRLGGLSLHGAF